VRNYQFKSRERAMLEREVGIRRPLMSPEEAAAHALSPREQAFVDNLRRNAVVGSIEQVKEKLDALAQRLDLDELVVVTWTYDPAPRMRSYELLAQAYGLQASPKV
jgi:alkanesulfonate monooxygenase SsuD/methylene tetrahydromethanopterin reductase-like flavin-dependent oxidoreductase (luciferase family)